MTRYTSTLLIYFAFNPICIAQNSLDLSKLKDFETYLQEEIKNNKAAGIEALIYHKGEIVWHEAIGFSSLQDKQPLEKNSIYYIQSMTKPIMSVAIMQLIEKGKLREDLYYRLAVVNIYVPELSERREDISLLAKHFVKQYSDLLGKKPVKLGDDLLNALRALPWPGSVRQLKNVIETIMILSSRIK